MATVEKNYREIAAKHGVELELVRPLDHTDRLADLARILGQEDVRFPIPPDMAEDYYRRAAERVPFGVGTLTGQSVDLGPYENFQHYEQYSMEEHLSWACLVADQQRTKHRYACREYLEGEKMFAIGGHVIPDYYLLNAQIYQQTGWQLATVSEIIPAELFFTCHSNRFFPVTTFMRALEQDYLQEPDIGHDIAGHVATFTIPAVAAVMKNHGEARDQIYAERDRMLAAACGDRERAQIQSWADELLLYAGRIYWFTVEFGLVMQEGEIRDFGAGILSSPGETTFSIDSPESNRILINPSDDRDLLRLAVTDYLISEYQKTYFVMSSFSELESLTCERIVQAAKRARQMLHYTWREIAPGDRVLHVGNVMVSANEKYWRLLAGCPVDECLTRAAIRNLRMVTQPTFDPEQGDRWLRAPMPSIPPAVVGAFQQRVAQGEFISDTLPVSWDFDPDRRNQPGG
ncbi:MAG TPA: hypothetical protein PKD54_07635 [Pirellulaceae bacterium]|nr:hypothetical protein [Pirellulaceae bacterium]